jgi:adenylosuccinate lyase
MLELIKKGISREKAYKIVQKIAMKSWKKKLDFQSLLQKDKEIKKYLDKIELRKLFDISYHLKNIDKIFKRVLK